MLCKSDPRRVRAAADQQPAGASRLFLQDAEINRAGAACALRPTRTESDLARRTQSHAGRGRDGAGYSSRRSVRRRARARIRQHPLSGQFASWAGTILGLSARPVLIAETPEQLSEARLRLARVGIEAERGYLEGGVAAWKGAGFELAQLHEITVQELQQRLAGNGIASARRTPAKRNGWQVTSKEPRGGRSTASGFLRRRLISMFRWRSTVKADIAA